MAREVGFIDKKFTSNSIDVIFSKAKAQGERKMPFKDFLWALVLVGDEKGIGYEGAAKMILNSDGPQSSGTKADNVKFHDDPSMYTGMYANRGK